MDKLRRDIDLLLQETLNWVKSKDDPFSIYEDSSSPLCSVYNNPSGTTLTIEETNCDGCPIMIETGARYCRSSPYGVQMYSNGVPHPHGDDGSLREAREAARKEIEFLVALMKKLESQLGECHEKGSS